MPFEVRACTIGELHQHPTISDRTVARVNVMLRESRARETYDHNLTVRVWANTHAQMPQSEINTALLTKAAAILKRIVVVAELPETLAS